MKDLVVLAADKDLEQTLRGLLARPQALGMRPVSANVFRHPEHDPACARRGVEFMSNFSEQYRHGMLIFDHEGSGMESDSPLALQQRLNEEFTASVWGDRARTIVLVPELEAWIWNDSPHVDDVAGWGHRQPTLRAWLIEQGWLRVGEVKPARPKEAFQAALREAGTPRSASLYGKLASSVSLRPCTDPAFLELRGLLTDWFPPDQRAD